ncbi:MAG: hypothetical protein OER80_04100 [Gammaproteobacteria bacterium]|nr:hypothetical protein [Gammaproteobacteria bacterium]
MADKVSIIIVSSLVGALVSYIGAVIKNTLDTRSRINDSLLEKRTDQYKILWDKTRLLPKWPRDTSVTHEKLRKLSEGLRDWYFDGGGIYLSRKSQRLYASLQEVVAGVTGEEKTGNITSDEHDNNNEYDRIRKACSTLRTSMTDDLLSRRGAPQLEFISELGKRITKQFTRTK